MKNPEQLRQPALRDFAVDGELLRPLMPAESEIVDDLHCAHVAVGLVRGLVEVVASAGVEREAYLRAAGFGDFSELHAPDGRVAYAELNRLVALALEMTEDPGLGLRWASELSDRAFAPLGHLAMHCTTLRQALTLLARYFPLFSNRRAYAFVRDGDVLRLQYMPLWGEPLPAQRFVAEMLVAGFWRLIRYYDDRAQLLALSFAHAAPAYAERYAPLFGGREVAFGQPYTGLCVPFSVLDHPAPMRDDEVREALADLAEQRLRRIQHGSSWVAKVREALTRHAPAERCDMPSVARELGVSVRSLRRRLSAEGQSFEGLLVEARCRAAKTLLRDPAKPIREVAYELGFSDASTFHRAFKRWSGTTPKSYRDTALRSPG